MQDIQVTRRLHPPAGPPSCRSPGSLGLGVEAGHGPSPPGRCRQLWSPLRLDEDGKVLTPEELLYRVRGAAGGPASRVSSWGHLSDHCAPQAVQSVNVTHDAAHAQMDVKLRSLICVGLK